MVAYDMAKVMKYNIILKPEPYTDKKDLDRMSLDLAKVEELLKFHWHLK